MNQNSGQVLPAESRARLPFWGIASFWAALVFFFYFFSKSHPLPKAVPFLGKIFDLSSFQTKDSSEFWEIQMESFKILLTTLAIFAGTWSSGRRIRKWLGVIIQDSWVRFAFDFGFGVCFLNLFWMGIGLEKLWYKALWMSFGFLVVLLCILDIYQLLKDEIPKNFKALFPKEKSYLGLLLIGGFYLIFSVFQNLAPETFYDSMVYHLAVPNYWIFQHGIGDFSTNFFSNYPFSAETYFLNGLVWQGTESAKMLHAASFGVCALLAGGWAREMAGEKAGWLALGLTLTSPLFAVNIWSTQVEGFLALALVLFAYAFYRFALGDGKQMVWALVSGVFAGLAFSTKYTAVLTVGCVLLVFGFQKLDLFFFKNWKAWLAMILGILVLLAPWVFKNIVFTGNPFFPYLMSHFPGRHLSVEGYGRLLEEQRARVTSGIGSWFLLPWTLTMANPDSYNFCGPVTLALVPFLFLFRLKNSTLKCLAFIAPLLLVAGLAITHILRFALPFFIFFNILAGALLAGGDKPVWGRVWAWVAGFSAVLCFAYLGVISHYYYSGAGIWSGRQSRAEYLMGPGKISPYYSLAQWVSKNLPSEDRLLIVGDARGLYYGRPFLSNSVFDDQVLAKIAREEKDPEGIGRRLKEMGVDDLVVNASEGLRVSADYHHYDLTQEEWKRLDDFIQKGTEAVFPEKFQGVYHILPAFKTAQVHETPDLITFFSQPVSRFVKNVQSRQWKDAENNLDEILKLYPYSEFWKEQKADFKKSVEALVPKN